MAENETAEKPETKEKAAGTPKEFASIVEQLEKLSALEISHPFGYVI